MKIKIKAFTFVELLLVMLILGIIISLTLPIVKNIKDDGDIYRAYMKKANQDVTDAINMIFIKVPDFTGFQSVKDGITASYDARFTASNAGLRYAFNKGLNTQSCKDCNEANPSECATNSDCTTHDFYVGNTAQGVASNPGLVLNGKPIWLFKWDCPTGAACPTDDANETYYGHIYVDMNKDKSPNKLCEDRFIFVVYNDRVAMEGCDYSL